MKRINNAIAAFAAVRDSLSGLILVVVGSGELGQSPRAQARSLGLNGSVHFAGHRTGNDKRWFLQTVIAAKRRATAKELPDLAPGGQQA